MNAIKFQLLVLVVLIGAVSCEKNNGDNNPEPSANYPVVLNDTIWYESPSYPTIYSLDLDQDGHIDGEIELLLHTSIGGNRCSIKLRIFDEKWSIASLDKLEYICQDTLNYMGGTWDYFERYDCDDPENAIRVDSIIIPELYQIAEIDNIVVEKSTRDELVLYSYYGVGSDGIFPGAVLNRIIQGVLKNGVSQGLLVFVKNDIEFYGLRIEIQTNDYFCNQLYIHQIEKSSR